MFGIWRGLVSAKSNKEIFLASEGDAAGDGIISGNERVTPTFLACGRIY